MRLSPLTLAKLACLALAVLCLPAGANGGAAARVCARIFERDPAHQGQPLDGDRIRILNWNLRKSSQPGWAEDLRRLARGADLVLLQEASLEAGVAEHFAASYHSVFAPGYTTRNHRSGVLTASRVAPGAHCALSHREPWLGTAKATCISRYPLRDMAEWLLVINLHGVNFSLGNAPLERQLADSATLAREHLGPVIFSGDFNTWNDARMAVLERVMADLGMRPLAFPDDRRSRIFGHALDHIYVRGLRVLEAGATPVTSSDHNPVSATLAVARQPTRAPASGRERGGQPRRRDSAGAPGRTAGGRAGDQ